VPLEGGRERRPKDPSGNRVVEKGEEV
jgi:hypothetical protein